MGRVILWKSELQMLLLTYDRIKQLGKETDASANEHEHLLLIQGLIKMLRKIKIYTQRGFINYVVEEESKPIRHLHSTIKKTSSIRRPTGTL